MQARFHKLRFHLQKRSVGSARPLKGTDGMVRDSKFAIIRERDGVSG